MLQKLPKQNLETLKRLKELYNWAGFNEEAKLGFLRV